MSSAAKQAKLRAARKAAGLCTECNNPRYRKHSLCQAHYKRRQERLAKLYRHLQDDNLCYCGAPVKPGQLAARVLELHPYSTAGDVATIGRR